VENFEDEVLNSEVPVLVDFWAAWCVPCRQVAPVMDEIARDYEGSVKVAKIDVDVEGDLAGRFGISSIPTIAFFEPGEQPKALVGVLPKESIVSAFGLDRFAVGGDGTVGKDGGPGGTPYTCPMHPEVLVDEPGRCPICGMNLVPRTGG
jgi:thioredoxin 1